MIDQILKDQWLESVKITTRKEIYSNGAFSINTNLYYAPDELKKDKEVALAALLIGQEFLWNIDEKFRNDKDFITILIENKYSNNIYSYISKELQEDPFIFEECMLRRDDIGWHRLPKPIVENRPLILKVLATSNIYSALKDFYKYDVEIVSLYLLNHNPRDYLKITKRTFNKLAKDKHFLLELIKKDSSLYEHFPENFKADLTIIHHLLTHDRYAISMISEELRNDKTFMSYAINKYDCSLEHCSEALKNDFELLSIILEKDGKFLKKYPYISDTKLAEIALKTCSDIRILNKTLLQNKELVIKFLEADNNNCIHLLELTKLYHDDYNIVKINTIYDGDLLKKSHKWFDNQELKELALNTSDDINLLTKELIANKSLVIKLLKKKVSNIDSFLNKNHPYKNDIDIVRINIAYNPKYIKYSPLLKNNVDIIKEAIGYGLNEVSYIDASLMMNKELMLLFITKDINNYEQLPLVLKNDFDIISKMFEASLQSINLVNISYENLLSFSTIANDFEFNIQLLKQHPIVYESNLFNPEFKNNKRILQTYLNHTSSFEGAIPQDICEEYGTLDPIEIKRMLNSEFLKEELLYNNQLNTIKKIKI